ncbi:MAG: hypothetical protein ACKOAT_00095, partial [Actinomycetota bacterium]
MLCAANIASCRSATRCCSTGTRSLTRVFKATAAISATDGAARAGIVTLARGTYVTPTFMPVGTRGAVKYLSAADYE